MHLVLHAQRKIRKISNQMGYDIVRKPLAESSLYLYDGFESACLAEKRFYNVGAGDFYHPYWTNIDYPTEHYAESQKHDFIHFNLMLEQPLPIDNNVAEIVYSSHTIEHISDGAAINMINEAYRILKPGGCLRITTPDAARSFDAYLRGDIEYWYYRRRYATNGTWEKYFKKPLDQATIQQLLVDHVATQVSGISLDPTPHEEFDDQQIKDIPESVSVSPGGPFGAARGSRWRRTEFIFG
jgi:predicted SAM-dependent methyltransferase